MISVNLVKLFAFLIVILAVGSPAAAESTCKCCCTTRPACPTTQPGCSTSQRAPATQPGANSAESYQTLWTLAFITVWLLICAVFGLDWVEKREVRLSKRDQMILNNAQTTATNSLQASIQNVQTVGRSLATQLNDIETRTTRLQEKIDAAESKVSQQNPVP